MLSKVLDKALDKTQTLWYAAHKQFDFLHCDPRKQKTLDTPGLTYDGIKIRKWEQNWPHKTNAVGKLHNCERGHTFVTVF